MPKPSELGSPPFRDRGCCNSRARFGMHSARLVPPALADRIFRKLLVSSDGCVFPNAQGGTRPITTDVRFVRRGPPSGTSLVADFDLNFKAHRFRVHVGKGRDSDATCCQATAVCQVFWTSRHRLREKSATSQAIASRL